jgi:hypothetical protein
MTARRLAVLTAIAFGLGAAGIIVVTIRECASEG